jgi:hypothetical protein
VASLSWVERALRAETGARGELVLGRQSAESFRQVRESSLSW